MSTTSLPSRTPSDYRPTDHFVDRKKSRDVPGWAIQEAIERGPVRRTGSGEIEARTETPGARFGVVICPDERAAITCYRID